MSAVAVEYVFPDGAESEDEKVSRAVSS